MLRVVALSLQASRRPQAPGTREVRKLLYGKRKNAVHAASVSKPSLAATLLSVRKHQLYHSVIDAARLNELTRECLLEVLRANRALNRLDRTEVVVRAAQDAGVTLTPYHYSTLLAHANDNQDLSLAMRFWNEAVKNGKANETVHSARLVSLRAAGKWRAALDHLQKMIDDKMQPGPHALHTVMNACRTNRAWVSALHAFSAAVDTGTQPSDPVYLELMRSIGSSGMPSKWMYSLSVLTALVGKRDLNAGLFNAAITSLAGHQWRMGMELYAKMRALSVLPSKETLNSVLALRPKDLSLAIACVGEAHTLGLPVADEMYRCLLGNLFRGGRDEEALAFIESEVKRSVQDTGNSINVILPLSIAALDSLLAHARPRDAQLILSSTSQIIENVIGGATMGLGTIGSASQRWIVQGRVGVVDHNALLSPRFPTLLGHYDSLIIPLSSVRLLVRRIREISSTARGAHATRTIQQLQRKLSDGSWRMVRVLPLWHQLHAHTYLVQETVSMRHDEAVREISSLVSPYQKLITGAAPGLHRTADVTAEPHGAVLSEVSVGSVALEPITIRNSGLDDTALPVARDALLPTDVPRPRAVTADSFRPYNQHLTNPERVLSVGAMLKTLNPDADIHIITPTAQLLELTAQWNAFHNRRGGRTVGGCQLQAVRFPEELSVKAPSEIQSRELLRASQLNVDGAKLFRDQEEPIDAAAHAQLSPPSPGGPRGHFFVPS